VAESVVAVLDVGKTNKKVSIYDRAFNVLADERTPIEPYMLGDIEVEDTDRLLSWFRDALKRLAKKYRIESIAITTHGATFAVLDAAGKLAHPVISYTSARGAEVQEEFYEVFGSREDLHRKTCTADIGFCNMAKVLYFIKTRLPEAYARCNHGLFYGPYLGYELTGQMGLEPTFPGNHTYFWDFAGHTWSDVARALGADRLFGLPMQAPWETLGTVKPELAAECGLPSDSKVTIGIHDSNANFLPYLAKGHDDFLLNSTGTWCVLMRNSATDRLTDEQIRARVFFNQDVLGRPVRTSLGTLGMDYDTFDAISGVKDAADREATRRVVAERKVFVIPGVLPDASVYPNSPARVIVGENEYLLRDLKKGTPFAPFTELGQEYRAALNLGLAVTTAELLKCCGLSEGTWVFTEGGFAKNRVYCQALQALCPKQQFALTTVKEGTSFGAAITAWMAATGRSLEEIGEGFSIERAPVEPDDFGDIEAYREAYLRHTRG
jgi:sugar (pentulose or hexulose) kinase